jgi:hypothetical protein
MVYFFWFQRRFKNLYQSMLAPYIPRTLYRPHGGFGCSIRTKKKGQVKEWHHLQDYSEVTITDTIGTSTEETPLSVGDFITINTEGSREGNPALVVQIKKTKQGRDISTFLLIAWLYQHYEMDAVCKHDLHSSGKRYILSPHFQIFYLEALRKQPSLGAEFFHNVLIEKVYDPTVKIHRVRDLGAYCILREALDKRGE